MILFKKIKWKNFLSTGDQWTEMNLNTHGTTLIVGTNGAGKSTVLDALCFVLFNKPYRKINKPQLVNTANDKGCLVEIEFSVGPKDYIVRRGIKPNVFDIIVDGEMRNKEADDRANQKMDIRIFSAMNSLIKEQIRKHKEAVKALEYKKSASKDKVRMQEEFILDIETRGKDNIKEKEGKIDSISVEIDTLMQKNETLDQEMVTLSKNLDEVSGATDKLKKLGNLKGKISQKVSTITKEHKFFTENTVCPTCTQSIEETFRLNKISDAQNRAKELNEGFKQLEESIKEEEDRERLFKTLSKEITDLTHGISQNNTRISGLQRQSRDLQSEIQTLTDQLQNRNSEHEKLEQYKGELQTVFDLLASKKEEINYNDFAYSLLKDGGVKAKIIKKYLPLINQQVNRYLQMMDFYINFHLDEEFNETIQNPIHDKFSYSSFSEGEKMRIDLALLFTWREVARFKNSANTNLLIMDEVFDSSLDGFGTDEFLKIIRYVIKDANVFVISHKQDMLDKFNTVIEFRKQGGFSYKSEKSAVEQ
jgi:DNA repair exonuclease SbcCD ATPase subunit